MTIGEISDIENREPCVYRLCL